MASFHVAALVEGSQHRNPFTSQLGLVGYIYGIYCNKDNSVGRLRDVINFQIKSE